jgi:predicted membrane protein
MEEKNMMMFQFHIAFSLGLIALSLGTVLFILSKQVSGRRLTFVKTIAFIVIILSIISILCTASSGIRLMQYGFRPMEMHKMMQMQDKGMRDNRESSQSM